MEGYEYRRYDGANGATPFWTPLRFAGQYHDEETDLNQNHNRFYEPLTGRYLEPEPLNSKNPDWLTSVSHRGLIAPTYAYVGNNPVNAVDEDGLSGCGGDRATRLCKQYSMWSRSPGDADGERFCVCNFRILQNQDVMCYTKKESTNKQQKSCDSQGEQLCEKPQAGEVNCQAECEKSVKAFRDDQNLDPEKSGFKKLSCPFSTYGDHDEGKICPPTE